MGLRLPDQGTAARRGAGRCESQNAQHPCGNGRLGGHPAFQPPALRRASPVFPLRKLAETSPLRFSSSDSCKPVVGSEYAALLSGERMVHDTSAMRNGNKALGLDILSGQSVFGTSACLKHVGRPLRQGSPLVRHLGAPRVGSAPIAIGARLPRCVDRHGASIAVGVGAANEAGGSAANRARAGRIKERPPKEGRADVKSKRPAPVRHRLAGRASGLSASRLATGFTGFSP